MHFYFANQKAAEEFCGKRFDAHLVEFEDRQEFIAVSIKECVYCVQSHVYMIQFGSGIENGVEKSFATFSCLSV